MWRLSMKKSTLTQVRLNKRVTFDRRIEVPTPLFYFYFFQQKMKKTNRFADSLIELANPGFGLSTDASLQSVKKFLDKKVRTCNSRSHSPPYPSHLLCFISRCLVPRSIYIFGIDCPTTLQVQEKLISRLPVEIHVQLRCNDGCGRILGNIGALQKF